MLRQREENITFESKYCNLIETESIENLHEHIHEFKTANGNLIQYRGSMKFGKIDGYGQYDILKGPGEYCSFRGNFIEDKRHGFGVLTCPDGQVQEGNYVNDLA